MFGCCKKKKTNKSLDELKKDIVIDDHEIPLDALLKRYSSSETAGISEAEAATRLKTDGPNALTPPKQTSKWVKLAGSIFGGFNFLLWCAAVASAVGYGMDLSMSVDEEVPKDNMYMAIILASVVTVTGFFDFYQDRKSGNLMDSFANMIPPKTLVVRDGTTKEIEVKDLVVGDLVRFRGGDRVPADLRVTLARGLKVDNSSLTGESEPQTRNTNFTSKNPLETKNLCLFSTSVLEGSGEGIIIRTGDRTVVGRIAALTTQVDSGPTPLAKEINHFIKIISVVAFTVGVAFFVLAVVYEYPLLKAIVFFMGIVVANVPEGIVPTVTVSLTLTAVKMRKKFCLVKKLQAVETLGSTSTICSDKTGTLTQNRMTVTHLWFDGHIKDAELLPPNEHFHGEKRYLEIDSYQKLLRCATLCSRSHFRVPEYDVPLAKRTVNGDASEVAIMRYCEMIRGDGQVDEFRKTMPKIGEIPFNSTNKYQLSIHPMSAKQNILVMKGAPEKILKLCSSYYHEGQTKNVSKKFEKDFQKAYETLGSYGERVLGFCDLEMSTTKYPHGYQFNMEDPNFPIKNLRFLGLIAMIDPPRPGVPEAVRVCQNAGIRVVMVTGDHPITARAIATQVHIIEENEQVTEIVATDPKCDPASDEIYGKGRLKATGAVVIHGEQLSTMSQKTLKTVVTNYHQIVFARTSPAQKLQIVEAFQSVGNVVGVTGDGVNDAPALRKADIGIAMGIAGTDVSKQAADMILLNDNFASIVTGVEEGRLIFDNLKKSIAYTLTSNIPEITPFMSYVLFGLPLPMSIIAILMIDLGTDLWPAISFAYEVPESDIMQRAPRNPIYDKLVNKRLVMFSYMQIGAIQACAGFTTYFVLMMSNGWFPQDLINLSEQWDNKYIDDLEDSYGQQWSYESRKALESCCYGTFFFTIVVTQWADLFASKTRKNSLVMQGLENQVLNTSVIFTCFLATFVLNTPFVNEVLGVQGFRLEIGFLALPFAFAIGLYDEFRRFFIRNYPGGYIYKETFY
ncbi:hypothetical protein GCK72_014653 [Caenorhabditis remanei]|uniref:Sodium/potassium-transporting ATPase subunit alpha n=1 Tax=Caenorhabditis remanei TaxID=31234 RepID=A0A6A5GUN9_CAERE|nr:hypothetical protein GCK72_014653 [Caenorhabditis remanei]KAF1758195.1 hypothetical protein GCK72_014653 [Caenorhabditis remanei]